VDIDNDDNNNHIIVNTAEGRVNQKNAARDLRVALSVADRANPYNMMPVQEGVVEETAKGVVNGLTRWRKSTFVLTSVPLRQTGQKVEDTREDKARKRIYQKAG